MFIWKDKAGRLEVSIGCSFQCCFFQKPGHSSYMHPCTHFPSTTGLPLKPFYTLMNNLTEEQSQCASLWWWCSFLYLRWYYGCLWMESIYTWNYMGELHPMLPHNNSSYCLSFHNSSKKSNYIDKVQSEILLRMY